MRASEIGFHRDAAGSPPVRALPHDAQRHPAVPAVVFDQREPQRQLGAFRASSICGAIVNAAGDIASFGGLGPGQPFRIGITDPFSPRRLAEVVYLTWAIATSGTYERGHHLIDPHTGRPAARAASASVTGPDLGLADALATALAVAGAPGLDLIKALDGYEALIIAPDGSRRWTEHFPFARRDAAPPR